MLFAAAGCLFTLAGAVGLVLPLVPGTLFLIIAAFCFARSSPRLEQWLLDHRWFGPPIVRWRATGAIPTKVKAIAVASMATSFGIVVATGAPTIALAGTAIVMAASAVYVVTRPSGG